MAAPRRPPPLRPALHALVLSALGALLASTSHARSTNAVDRFDEAIARELPQTIVLSDGKSGGALVIESLLDVELHFPDVSGDVPGAMYRVTWRGEQAVLTRYGRHFDISMSQSGSVKVIGFSGEADGSHHLETGDAHGLAQPVTGQVLPRMMAMPRYAAGKTAIVKMPRGTARPTLIFWMFLHDDTLGVTREHIHARYVAWWLADMKRILPLRRLSAIYSQQVAGLTDIPYGHASSLRDWTAAVDGYARREKLPHVRGEFEYKFMLLTHDEVAPGVSGLAWLGGEQAMASLMGRYTIVAHEYGHTLTARHEDAEVRWSSGWPCETNLKSAVSLLRANCYRYSAANERRMRSYMANEWTVPVRPDPPNTPHYMVE